MSRSFQAEMAAALPAGMTLAQPLVRLLDWIAAEGQIYTYTNGRARFGTPYPQDPMEPGHPAVVFEPTDPDHARLWLGTDSETAMALAPILRSGGDGSAIAQWRAADGTVHYVHLGSGSGSTMAGVMTSNPVDLIRLLALGYDELCWPDEIAMRPADVWDVNGNEGPYVAPVRFQNWVQENFNVTLPDRATDITGTMGDFGDPPGDDPFLNWLVEIDG